MAKHLSLALRMYSTALDSVATQTVDSKIQQPPATSVTESGEENEEEKERENAFQCS